MRTPESMIPGGSAGGEEREARLLRALNAAAAALHRSARSEAEVSRAFSEQIARLGLVGALLLLDSSGESLTVHGAGGMPELAAIEGLARPVEAYPAGRLALESRQAACYPAGAEILQQLLPGQASLGEAASGAAVVAPLAAGEDAAGVLIAVGEGLAPEDLPALKAFATDIAIALENGRAFQAERLAHKQAETIREAAQVVSSSLKLDKILELILAQLGRLIRFDNASVCLFDEEGRPGMMAGVGFEDKERVKTSVTQLLAGNPVFTRMAETLQPVNIPDTSREPGWVSLPGNEAVKSFLGVPVILGGAMMGALLLDRKEEAPFSEDEARIAQLLAEHIAVAIENAQEFEAEGLRAAELEAVRQASLSLTASLELGQVLDAILKGTLSLLPEANSSHIFLYSQEGGGKLTFGSSLLAAGPHGRPYRDPRPNGLTYMVARLGEMVAVNDMSTHPLYKDLTSELGGAILGLPLKIRQRVVGVMTVLYRQPRSFPDAELRMLRFLGDQAAIAIENARLYEQAAVERRHLGLLYDLNREMATSLDPDEILSRAITLTCKALDGLVGQAFLYIPEEERLSLRALYGRAQVYASAVEIKLSLKIGQGLGGWVAETLQPANVADVLLDPRWVHFPGIDDEVHSAICAPIVTGGRLVGVVTLLHRQPGAFSQDHLVLLQAICQELGLALSNASRYQQVQRRLAEITLIQSLAQTINQRLELQVLLDEVITQLVQKLGYSQVEISLLEGDELVLMASHTPVAIPKRISVMQGITGRVARTGEVAYIPDVRSDPDYIPGSPGTVSELAVPIYRGTEVVGVINIESHKPDLLSTQDRDLIQVLAGQISVALENAVLYERVRRHAEELEHTVAQRTAELTELYKLSQEIGYQLSYEQLLRLLLTHLRNAIHSDLVVGCLASGECRTLSIETCRPLTQDVLDEVRSYFTETLLKYREDLPVVPEVQVEIVMAEDYDEDSPPIQVLDSLLRTPLLTDGKLAGILIAASERTGAFGAVQKRLLDTFANQATGALQRLAAVLTAQQKHLESLVEHMPIGMLLFDSDFRLLVANPLGREILTLLNPGDGLESLNSLGGYPLRQLVAHQQDPVPLEIACEGPPRRGFGVQIRPVGEDSRQWVLIVREITQERESQARIQSQERLATVGQLAAGIAHDFNNIMAAILVYADLLCHDPNLPLPSREKLTIIQQQVHRAASLIRQILDFSRRSVMDQDALDLLPFIKELDKMLGRILPETIRLELRYQQGAYWVNADPTRLQQVFMNLALNSRDAMPGGGVLHFDLSRYRLHPRSIPPMPGMPPGDWILVTVRDTGEGIPPEVQRHIFEPFFTTKPVGQGTGLGLAQVYGIIKQHDGYIDVSSQAGAGTTFQIYLPMLGRQEQAEPLLTGAQIYGHGETVLVVEDDTATRQALQALLEAHDYRVVTASDGKEALVRYEEAPGSVSLVVSDIVMPEMGGVALYRTLRKRWPGLKMLFVTGHPLDKDSQALLEHGEVHWLQKPFSVQEFNQTVQVLLRES